MTEQTADPVVLLATPGGRLEALQASYESAKAAAQEAKDRFEAITTALKTELAAAAPGRTEVHLAAAPGLTPLKLTWKQPYRFDVKRFRAERPEEYVRYEVKSQGFWELRSE